MGGSEELKLLLVRKFEPRRVKDDDGRAGGDAAEQADEDVARPCQFFVKLFCNLVHTLAKSCPVVYFVITLKTPIDHTRGTIYAHRATPGAKVIKLFTAVIYECP
jgi:hypothetical protein